MCNRWNRCTRYQVLVWLLCCLIPVRIFAAEAVLMRVYLNQEDKGDRFFQLDGQDPLFTGNVLRSMGLERLPDVTTRQIDGVDYLSLASMQPAVTWRIDEQQSAIYIDAPPYYFRKQSHSKSFFNAPEGLAFTNERSAYANYGVNITGGEGLDTVTLTAPFEVALHAGDFSAFSNFLYTNSDDDSQFVRLISAVTRDDRESLTRLTLGDFAAFTGVDGGAGLFGGISFSRNFSIDPYFNRFTSLSVYGAVNTQSQVEYYLDDHLMFSEQLSPGQFEFQDVRPPTGAHQTRMVIRDVYGNENVTYGDFYYTSRILKPGVHEFSYNAGFERDNFGRLSNDYGKPVALGFHRTGLTEWLTLGGRAEFSSDVSNVGGSTSILLSRFGEMEVSLSGSSAESTRGYAASADYRYITSLLSLSARFRTLSRHYANLTLEPDDDKTHYEWQTGLALNFQNFGSWTAYYSVRQLHSGIRTKRATLFFSKRIGRFASLVASYTRLSGAIKDDEFFLSLGRPLGRNRSGFVDYRKRNNRTLLSARISKNRPVGEGFGYVLDAGLQTGKPDINLFGEYAGPAGIYSAGYRNVNGNRQYRAGMAGSVSWLGSGIHFSRPITDSFALVKVERLRDVDVRFNNQFMGRTNQDGELIVPRLQAYVGNRISLDNKDIPINYEFAAFDQLVAAPFRGGAIVTFDGTKLQAFTGQITVDRSGKREPAEYWGLRFESEGRITDSIIGKSGEFYLENLAPGRYPAEIFSSDAICRFTLNIPESEEVYVNLGEINCEVSRQPEN